MTPQQTASQTKTAINSLCASEEKRPKINCSTAVERNTMKL